MKQFEFILTAFALCMPSVFAPLGLLQEILCLHQNFSLSLFGSDVSKLNG